MQHKGNTPKNYSQLQLKQAWQEYARANGFASQHIERRKTGQELVAESKKVQHAGIGALGSILAFEWTVLSQFLLSAEVRSAN